jgi:hypothetical protein
MSVNAAVHFRDPFASRGSSLHREPHQYLPTVDWTSRAYRPDLNRPLTPPPDMTGVTHASHSGNYHQELGRRYNNYDPAQAGYRAPAAHHVPYDFPSMRSHTAGTRSHTLSPAPSSYHPRQTTHEDQPEVQSRKPSTSLIAPSFQIPRTVNSSGGSLSELAAQITCLFWFESSDILQQIEDSAVPASPSRSLVKDAMPTTGFRKWVTTILSTTLVAQNVVLLALLFVHRLKKLNPAVKGKPGSEYRLLTVALMLGNKFLDDNTYTNKTWAEVSGINVGEVHIMEVEFLSNMKYCLFTSAEDWAKWQTLLGRYAAFFDQATREPLRHHLAPILPAAPSLHLPLALPSPPVSNQASPPYSQDSIRRPLQLGAQRAHGLTPTQSPMPYVPLSNFSLPGSRKRSRDDYAAEPLAKRVASGLQDYASPHASFPSHNQRVTLPSLAIPANTGTVSQSSLPTPKGHQLAPLNVPARAMAMVYPTSASQPHTHAGATAGPFSQSQTHSQHGSRQHSPFHGSAVGSPTGPNPSSTTVLQPPAQVSPSYFLQQRNSPYRPIRNVSTLLYPPPSTALQHTPQKLEFNQMSYQPLSKSTQQRQTGHLPYVSQNVWLDGNHQPAMTPVHQWPGFQGR